MNSKKENVKSTYETPSLNSFSFLDVKITRKNERFVTLTFLKAIRFLLIMIFF